MTFPWSWHRTKPRTLRQRFPRSPSLSSLQHLSSLHCSCRATAIWLFYPLHFVELFDWASGHYPYLRILWISFALHIEEVYRINNLVWLHDLGSSWITPMIQFFSSVCMEDPAFARVPGSGVNLELSMDRAGFWPSRQLPAYRWQFVFTCC